MKRTACFLVAAVLAAVGCGGAAAWAQNGSMSMGLYSGDSSFRPDLSARDLKVIIRVLGLSGDAQKALQDLYDGYAGTLASEGREVRDFVNAEIEQAELMNDAGRLGKAREKLAAWGKRSDQVKKTFLDDLKSLLSRDEEARWPIVERELRRLKLVGSGRLSGEDIDLVHMTEDSLGKAEPGTEMSELLNRYSNDLDQALRARERTIQENQEKYTQALKADQKAAKAIWKECHDARTVVQAVNDRYAKLIELQLGEGKGVEFGREYFKKCYRAVCKPTRVEEYLKDAKELTTLTPDQRARLEVIAKRFESEKTSIQVAMAKAWRMYENETYPSDLDEAVEGESKWASRQQYNGAWLPDTHPLVVTRKDRLTLDRRVRGEIDAVLTQEQKDSVPSRATPYAKFDDWRSYGL